MANDWSVDVQVNGSETFAAKMEFLNKQLKMFSSVLAESAASMGKNAASVQDLLVKKQMLRNSIAVEQTAQEALREEYDRQSKKLEEQKKKYKELSETVAAGSDLPGDQIHRNAALQHNLKRFRIIFSIELSFGWICISTGSNDSCNLFL